MEPGVYILECSNGSYYTGSTDNKERRLAEHNNGRVKATKYIIPVMLKLFIPCKTLTVARKLEYKIKRQKSRKVIEKLIKGEEINWLSL